MGGLDLRREHGCGIEAGLGVGAEQRQIVVVADTRPHFFQHCRAGVMAVRPQQAHHLAERAHGRIVPARTQQQVADHAAKACFVRLAIVGKMRQQFGRIERQVLPPLGRRGRVEACVSQPALQFDTVRRRGDDDNGVTLADTRCNKAFECVQQCRVAVVQLQAVGARRLRGPELVHGLAFCC